MQQLRNDYSLTFPPLSIARYSFIQLSRLRRREVKENAQTSKRYQRGFEPGLSRLRVRHSTTEPPHYHWKCVTCHGLHILLEKDSFLTTSVLAQRWTVSCLEYTHKGLQSSMVSTRKGICRTGRVHDVHSRCVQLCERVFTTL